MPRRDYEGNAVPAILVNSIASTSTELEIDNASGWPSGGANGKFYITIDRGLTNEERALVNSRTGNVLTLATDTDRGVDGTTATAHTGGTASVEHTYSGVDADEANQHINDDTQDNHPQYMKADGTRHDTPVRHTAGTVIPTAVPTNLTAGDTAAEGASTSLARANHIHGVPTATAVDIGIVNSQGAATTLSRSDHVHAIGAGAINSAGMLAAGVVTDAALAGSITRTKLLTPASTTSLWLYSVANEAALTNITSPTEGDLGYTIDTDIYYRWNGAEWVAYSYAGAWTSFTPSWTAVTFGTGSKSWGRYKREGKTVTFQAGFQLGTGGAITGNPTMAGPAGLLVYDPGLGVVFSQVGPALAADDTGSNRHSGTWAGSPGTNTWVFRIGTGAGGWDADTPFIWAVNDHLHVGGVFEII